LSREALLRDSKMMKSLGQSRKVVVESNE
jgi:hypothetical protein